LILFHLLAAPIATVLTKHDRVIKRNGFLWINFAQSFDELKLKLSFTRRQFIGVFDVGSPGVGGGSPDCSHVNTWQSWPGC